LDRLQAVAVESFFQWRPLMGIAGTAAPFSAQGECTMATQAETLRKAIENLVDAKLVDAMARPDGLSRLLAHRRTGVASPDIRSAERNLEETLGQMLSLADIGEEQLA
jgi:hypothetical protein